MGIGDLVADIPEYLGQVYVVKLRKSFSRALGYFFRDNIHENIKKHQSHP
jgi:hypothetical protein